MVFLLALAILIMPVALSAQSACRSIEISPSMSDVIRCLHGLRSRIDALESENALVGAELCGLAVEIFALRTELKIDEDWDPPSMCRSIPAIKRKPAPLPPRPPK